MKWKKEHKLAHLAKSQAQKLDPYAAVVAHHHVHHAQGHLHHHPHLGHPHHLAHAGYAHAALAAGHYHHPHELMERKA